VFIYFIGVTTPYRILFSYRGDSGSRHIDNYNDLVSRLNESFPYPRYLVTAMLNSDPYITAEAQVTIITYIMTYVAVIFTFKFVMIILYRVCDWHSFIISGPHARSQRETGLRGPD